MAARASPEASEFSSSGGQPGSGAVRSHARHPSPDPGWTEETAMRLLISLGIAMFMVALDWASTGVERQV